jgi:hypothetical protein
MKTATIPSLRVDEGLRRPAESMLMENESLSNFVELSLRAGILRRQMQGAFTARGLTSRDEAARTGEYYAAESALSELDEMLKATQSSIPR